MLQWYSKLRVLAIVLLAANLLMLLTYLSLSFIIHYLLFVIYSLLFILCYLFFVIYSLLFILCYLSFTNYSLFMIYLFLIAQRLKCDCENLRPKILYFTVGSRDFPHKAFRFTLYGNRALGSSFFIIILPSTGQDD